MPTRNITGVRATRTTELSSGQGIATSVRHGDGPRKCPCQPPLQPAPVFEIFHYEYIFCRSAATASLM